MRWRGWGGGGVAVHSRACSIMHRLPGCNTFLVQALQARCRALLRTEYQPACMKPACRPEGKPASCFPGSVCCVCRERGVCRFLPSLAAKERGLAVVILSRQKWS